MKKCSGCEFRRRVGHPKPGKKIPGGTGKCVREGGPCDEYIPAGNIGEEGERAPVITKK